MFRGIFRAEEVANTDRKVISTMKISSNDLFLIACGSYFWLEFPLLHLLCCPAAVMMLTGANMRFSSGGGPLTRRQWNRIDLFLSNLVLHERVLVQTCHVGMCGSERVGSEFVMEVTDERATLTVTHLQPSVTGFALQMAQLGPARHGLTPCDESSKRRSVSAMKHILLYSCKHGICVCFGFALISLTFELFYEAIPNSSLIWARIKSPGRQQDERLVRFTR